MKNPQAYRVYLTLSGASSLFNAMMFTLLTVYYIRVAELNPLQLVLVGTVMEATVFVFEVPTGVVADIYSRRLSVIIGTFVTGMALVFVGFATSFPTIALGLAVYGLGSTFLSGAREAWIVDEVGEEYISYVFLRTAQLRRIAALIGTFLSVGLASIQLNLPIILGGSLTILLGVYLILFMPETSFHPAPRTELNSWQSMSTTLNTGIQMMRRRPLMLWFLAIAVVFGTYAEAFDRLGEAHFLLNFTFPELADFDPVIWFGIISAGVQLLGFAAAGGAVRWLHVESRSSAMRALFVLQILWIGSVIVFGLTESFPLAVAAYWAVGVISTIHGPIYNAWLNQNIESQVRATALSIVSQADSLGQFTGGPTIGAIGTLFSLRAAMVVAGLVLSPAFLLYTQGHRKKGIMLETTHS